ncbi:lytic polysaccharide monooxygenase [Neolentinus lepideus HHB14362 ss-1]|uniref:AA9 family lytic polysaccharide monooxygenase n=1 Tax=Neolentinus lepideus HHB14362 ss-1 TaxID=1314782 RepID=A0A165N4E2_9AGAM|nr:lytic polysaccharide monooxygenase [Neolentinus lepideus HHB14362 ss-1]
MVSFLNALLVMVACAPGEQDRGYVDALNVGGTACTKYLLDQDLYRSRIASNVQSRAMVQYPAQRLWRQGPPSPSCCSHSVCSAEIQFPPAGPPGPLHTSSSFMTSYKPTSADKIWFKIDQGGYSNGKLAAAFCLRRAVPGPSLSCSGAVPRSLQDTRILSYIALHSAQTYPGTQFYMNCFQIASGAKSPASGYLVSFPGADTPPLLVSPSILMLELMYNAPPDGTTTDPRPFCLVQ